MDALAQLGYALVAVLVVALVIGGLGAAAQVIGSAYSR